MAKQDVSLETCIPNYYPTKDLKDDVIKLSFKLSRKYSSVYEESINQIRSYFLLSDITKRKPFNYIRLVHVHVCKNKMLWKLIDFDLISTFAETIPGHMVPTRECAFFMTNLVTSQCELMTNLK